MCATHTVETQHVSTKQDEIWLLENTVPNYTQWGNDFLPRDAVCAALLGAVPGPSVCSFLC